MNNHYDPTPDSDYLQDAIIEIESLQFQLEEAKKRVEELEGYNLSFAMNQQKLEQVILQMATILQDMELDEWGTDHADGHTLAAHECLVEHRDLLNELGSR